jgi:hypothetical protein
MSFRRLNDTLARWSTKADCHDLLNFVCQITTLVSGEPVRCLIVHPNRRLVMTAQKEAHMLLVISDYSS